MYILLFNRGRTVTYKMKQQHDVDRLYELEYFDFERKTGTVSSNISCKIRGVRDPTQRTEQAPRPARQQPQGGYFDDGTREIRILGCEYRLLES